MASKVIVITTQAQKNTLLGQQHLTNSPPDNNDNKGVATTGTVADADADADTYTYTMQ